MKIQDSITKLEGYANQLENQEIDLDAAVATYAKSVKLAKSVLDELTKTKGKISELDAEIESYEL